MGKVSGWILWGLVGWMGLNGSAAYASGDTVFWPQITAKHKFDDRWWVFGEFQPRWFHDLDDLQFVIYRAAVGYQLTPEISVALGAAWIPAFHGGVDEGRFFEQFIFDKKHVGASAFSLMTRVRLEQRRFFALDAWTYRLRVMERVLCDIGSSSWSALVADEVFFNANHRPGTALTGFDQNRLYLGAQYRLAPWVTLEPSFLFQSQRIARTRSIVTNHGISLGANFSI